jgi:hypothetical protein
VTQQHISDQHCFVIKINPKTLALTGEKLEGTLRLVDRPHDTKWRPTLVVEVDRGGDDEVVSTAAHALKRVCSDRRGANVVLVLGDDTDVRTSFTRLVSAISMHTSRP